MKKQEQQRNPDNFSDISEAVTDNSSNLATKRSFKPIVFDLKEGAPPKKMREEQTAPSRLDRRRSSSLTDSKNNTANDENLDDSFSIDLGGMTHSVFWT